MNKLVSIVSIFVAVSFVWNLAVVGFLTLQEARDRR